MIKSQQFTKVKKNMMQVLFGVSLLVGLSRLLTNQMQVWVQTEEELFLCQIWSL